MQIRRKLPIVFNILICIPLVILALVSYSYSTRNYVTKSRNNIRQLALSEGKALASLIESRTYQVQMLAKDKRIIDYMKNTHDEQKERIVQEYLQDGKSSGGKFEIVLLDEVGNAVLTTMANDHSVRLKNSESFREVLQGKVTFKEMVYTQEDSVNTINITVPIWDDNSHIIGVVCEVMNGNEFSEFGKSIQIDKTGYAFITDERLYTVVHPIQENVGKALGDRELRRVIKNKMARGETVGEGQYVYDHQEKYTSFYIIQDIGWVLCITQNMSEMQRQAFVGSLLIVGTMLVLMCLVNIVSRRLIKGITIPIDALIETMDSASCGEFTNYCTYVGNDEFGELSKNYNKMLVKLGESHENLNSVCRELEETKKELEYNYNELKQSKEALVKSEERYKFALDAIDEVIWEYHVETGDFYTTDNWNKIMGYPLEGKSIKDMIESHLEPQVGEHMVYNIQRCLAGEIRDFTQELWLIKVEKKICLLCKGHAITNENGQVEKMIGILTDITNNKRTEETVCKLTYFDALTGCLNKGTFIESLDAWLGSGNAYKTGALLFVDLDDFKKINDVLSHEIGDKVLNFVGKQLAESIPQDTFIGRFGGDEFVIFKTAVEQMDEVHGMVYEILSLFQNPIIVDQTKVHLTCSIGIAMYPEDGSDSAMLLKNADTAMYKVKENGKNSYSFYTKAMSQTLDRKLLIEGALREAVVKNSFFLQYQPVVELASGLTTGCEALIRLCDSELGFISPGEFIPIAEETDLIIEAGDWVLENAMKALKHLHEQGYTEFTMNINVSSVQIREEIFLDKLKKVIRKVGVLPSSIKLEVTESVLMENIEKSIELFNRVKALGIRIVLDDFGTGYSSLNYLRSIPLDILKIDKSFIDEITTSKVLSEIVDSIINMAHALNILVVAEGVENECQLEVLRNKGCDMIQGYYYSKPLSEEALEERLAEESRLDIKKEFL